MLVIPLQAGPNSKAAVKGFSWPLARTGDNGNYLKRHQDPNCRPFVFSNNLGQVLKIPLEKMLSEDVTLLVPSGLAFGRLDKMSRVFQWFGQIVPYRPFAESDITKWDRKGKSSTLTASHEDFTVWPSSTTYTPSVRYCHPNSSCGTARCLQADGCVFFLRGMVNTGSRWHH